MSISQRMGSRKPRTRRTLSRRQRQRSHLVPAARAKRRAWTCPHCGRRTTAPEREHFRSCRELQRGRRLAAAKAKEIPARREPYWRKKIPRRAITLDGDVEGLDALEQAVILGELRAFGVDTVKLLTVHLSSPLRPMLVSELRRVKDGIALDQDDPYGILAALATYGPEASVIAEARKLVALARRVEQFESAKQEAATSSPPSAGPAQWRDLFPFGRAPAIPAHTTQGQERFVAKIRQGFMRKMRGLTFRNIEPCVRAAHEAEARAKYPRAGPALIQKKARRESTSEACRLTADFIRAFYPLFGRTTTPDNVRKAL